MAEAFSDMTKVFSDMTREPWAGQCGFSVAALVSVSGEGAQRAGRTR